MKITKEQTDKIKELYQEGKTQKEISEITNIAIAVVHYWVNESSREKTKARAKEWYKKQSKEKKRELNLRRKEYRRDYYRNRYQTDEEYRKRRIELSKEGNKRKRRKQNGNRNKRD